MMGCEDLQPTAPKPPFEPSELIEHGDADTLTQGAQPAQTSVDGTYTS